MFINVQIQDDKCICTPITMSTVEQTVFYANFKRNLFKELYTNDSLKDDFPSWFQKKRIINENEDNDKSSSTITYTLSSGDIVPVKYWYDGTKFKDIIKGE